jgi:hypothetical protein
MDSSMKKPSTIDDYKNWLKQTFSIEKDQIRKIESHYNTVTNNLKIEFEKSNIWDCLTSNLIEYNDAYLIKTGYPLFVSKDKPKLLAKDFEAFFLKTFRKNILENEKWPAEPKYGWILRDNWYSSISDIIRTVLQKLLKNPKRKTLDLKNHSKQEKKDIMPHI